MNIKTFSPATLLSAAIVGAAAAVTSVAPAQAFTISIPAFGYTCISNNNPTNCTIGQNQFSTKVSQFSPTQVLFQFFNSGSQQVVMTDIYFEDTAPTTLGSVAEINVNNVGTVNYQSGARPSNLPDGNTVSFTATSAVSPTNPSASNGIGVGEVLGIVFNIRSGFQDPFNAIVTDLQRGSLRVGVRAQAYANGGSESFVNGAVPEPMTLLGSGAAIGAGALLKRRNAKRKDEEEKKEKEKVTA